MGTDVLIKSGEQPRYFRFGSTNNYTTSTGDSNAIYKESPYSAFQAIVTGTGTVTGTVNVQVTNEDATAAGTKANWITIGTITLSGTTTATDGFTTVAPWRWVRINVSAISGTDATVEVIMAV